MSTLFLHHVINVETKEDFRNPHVRKIWIDSKNPVSGEITTFEINIFPDNPHLPLPINENSERI